MNNSDKIIIDLCGGTGAWSKFYKDAGYAVYLITLPDYDVTQFIIKDGFIIFFGQAHGIPDIYIEISKIHGILAAPPCKEFSYAKSNSKYPRNIEKGMITVFNCLKIIWEIQYKLPTPLAKRTNLKFWALENPYGLLRFYIGKPALIFQPFEYGDRYQKRTCLWGNFKEPKKNEIKLSIAEKEKFGVNSQKLPTVNIHIPLFPEDSDYKLPPGADKRAARRAITPPGFAKAFFKANQ